MATDPLQALSALDSAHLVPVVRRALGRPDFELGPWEVRRLSDQGIINPDGLFVFSGTGQDGDGSRAWAVVLKVLRAGSADLDPSHLWHWRREASVMEAGLLDHLPGPIVAPRCYGVEERSDGAWLWIELIQDKSPRRWGEAEFAFAAEQLGQATGAWLASGVQRDDPWLCRSHSRTWAEGWPPTKADWANPYVQAGFPEALRRRLLAVWDERDRLYAALEHLPQTFAHFDSQRRNLMIRAARDGQDELVAVDWAWCGLGPVGAEAASLLVNSAVIFEFELEDVAALDETIFTTYLAGLRHEGWADSVEAVRLAYDATTVLFCGVTVPTLTMFWTHPEYSAQLLQLFGRDAAGCAQGWAAVAEFALDRGEAALATIKRLRFNEGSSNG